MISKQKGMKMETYFDKRYTDAKNRFNDIGKPDYPYDQINNYADFIELSVLFSNNDGISYGDIFDSFFGEPDENTDAEKKDKNEAFLKRVFSLIDERISLYAESYPFQKNENVLFLKKDISENNKYYIFLLIASQLNIFTSFLNDLTTDFETLSSETLKKFLPNAIIKQFGKNTNYVGNAKQKIQDLAKDLGIPINYYEVQQVGNLNNQERGLDVVGWLPFDDKCQNKIVFLGQCACGKNFESKQHDTRRFEEYLIFYKTKPQHTLFIPYSLINVNECKFYGNYIEKDYLVFERKRMTSLLNGNKIYNQLLSKDLIEKCINDN
jgi:hypothetical protein